jgi:hypothetical protein
LRLNLQEIGGIDDFRAAKPPKFQKMIVTGDKIFGSGGNGAFKYAVIRSETARRMAPDSARLSIRRGIPAKFSREIEDVRIGRDAEHANGFGWTGICVASVNCLELPADGHLAWDVRWQGLKPNLLQFVYGPTKVVP